MRAVDMHGHPESVDDPHRWELPRLGPEHGVVSWRRSGEGLGPGGLARWAPGALARIARDALRGAAELERVRQARLRRMLVHAWERVPAWRERFSRAGIDATSLRQAPTGDLLGAIPPLEPEELRADPGRFVTRAARPGQKRLLRWVRTSGSSGTPLTVVCDTREYVTSLVTILAGFSGAGWRPWRSLAYVCVPAYHRPRRPLETLGLFREVVVDLREGPRANLEQLCREAPDVIYGYPSHLVLVARLIRSGSEGPAPRAVVTNGEPLLENSRRILQEAFGCIVRDTYGSAEFHRLALECDHGALHVVPSAAHVEVERAGAGSGGAGDVLVTGFYQRTMPLVRYRIGDQAVVLDGPCRCGSPLPALCNISGRRDDSLRMPDGRLVSPRAVSLLEDVPGIDAFQVVQTALERIEVLVQPGPGYGACSAGRAEEVVTAGLAGAEVVVEVRAVDEIPFRPGGKRPAVVCRIGPREEAGIR